MEGLHHRHASQSSLKRSHTKRQMPQANLNSLMSDIRRVTPANTPSEADAEPMSINDTPYIPPPITQNAPTLPPKRPAKNHTSTSTVPKVSKNPISNINASSIVPTKPRQTGITNNRHTGAPVMSTITPVETSLAAPNQNVAVSSPHSSRGMKPSTLYGIIGGATVGLLILSLSIWRCSKRRIREEKRRSIWGVASTNPYEYEASSYEPHSEKPTSRDAKVLNGIQGDRLSSGPSLSEKSRSRSQSRSRASRRSRESKLWGSAEDMGDSYPMPLPYHGNHKEKSMYEDLDFGPAVMSTFGSDSQTPVPTLPPLAHQSEDDQRDLKHPFNHGVNGLGLNGWERANLRTEYPFPIQDRLLNQHQNKTELTKSNTTAHQRKLERKPLQTSSSMNRLGELNQHAFDLKKEQARRKKDTIMGLTDAYGNENGWGEVELDPMPTDTRALQAYSTNPNNYFNSYDPTSPYASGAQQRLAVPAPAMISASTSRSTSPQDLDLHGSGSTSPSAKPMMSPSEASKELEDMLHRLGNSQSNQPSPSRNSHLAQNRLVPRPSIHDRSSPNLFERSPNALVQQNLSHELYVPSTNPKITGETSESFTEPPTRGQRYYSQTCDVSNYTGQIGQVVPGEFTTYPDRYPNEKTETTSWIEYKREDLGTSHSKLFPVLPHITSSPTFTLPGLDRPNPSSPTFTNIYPSFESPSSACPPLPPPPVPAIMIGSDRHQDRPDQGITSDVRSNENLQDAYRGIHDYVGRQEYLRSKSGLTHADSFLSLSQMNLERLNPSDYRSPTYSIYGMYNHSPNQQPSQP